MADNNKSDKDTKSLNFGEKVEILIDSEKSFFNIGWFLYKQVVVLNKRECSRYFFSIDGEHYSITRNVGRHFLVLRHIGTSITIKLDDEWDLPSLKLV